MATDASTDPALDAAIRAIPSWEGKELEIVPIAEGRTNRNFRVTAGDESFFLRLSEKSTELLGIDRTAEQDSVRAAAEAGVGPEVFVYLPDLGCLVTRWIDAEPLAEGDLERARGPSPRRRRDQGDPRRTRALVVVRPVPDRGGLPARSPRSAASTSPMRTTARTRRPRAIEAAFASDPMPIRPCHNDLLEANFLLRDGHVWVVDHEYAGMGDPFFDLGNLSINNGLSDDAQERLLALYFGEPDRRAPRSPEADADHVGLPRGDVGRGAAGIVDARHRLRRVRAEALRPALHARWPTRASTTGSRPPRGT